MAINASLPATNFIIPEIATEGPSRVPFSHFFDLPYFTTTLSSSCPQITIIPHTDDLWDKPSTSPAVPISPNHFPSTPQLPLLHNSILAKPEDWTSAPSTERGAENSAQSGLGDGDITIALQKYFPYPKPSLSTLPHGTAGDVILTAVIDEHGKISGLTLLQGLGPAIDNEVIQTVNQWTYTPATKNGVPVASVQELHFHYERNG